MKRLFNNKKSTDTQPVEQQPVEQPAEQQQSFIPNPPPIHHITQIIGWSVAHNPLDFPILLQLADYISTSTDRSKEAARAIRKELKYGQNDDAKQRAIRLLGVLMSASDLRFRQQIVSKKFLAELSDLGTSKKTAPAVHDMLLKVLSPLAWEYQRDQDLLPLTTLYNKLRPASAPLNGSPLPADSDLFTPTSLLSSHPRSRSQRPGAGGGRGGGGGGRIRSTTEHLSLVTQQAKSAKSLAVLFSESLSFTPPDEVVEGTNELVSELYRKAVQAQEGLVRELDWVGSLAGSGSGVEGSEGEEAQHCLALVLSANSDIMDALTTHDLIVSRHKEQLQLQQVSERSIVEQRGTTALYEFDKEDLEGQGRNLNGEGGSGSGSNGAGVSRGGSGSGSNGKGETREGNLLDVDDNEPQPHQHQQQQQHQAGPNAYITSTPPTTLGYPTPPTMTAPDPYASLSYLTSEPSPLPLSHEEVDPFRDSLGQGRPREGTMDSTFLPAEPSEKAYGKLRRVSMRTDNDPETQQTQLEQALRDKYERNLREMEMEKERRRSSGGTGAQSGSATGTGGNAGSSGGGYVV
ncbi:hypothetical protein T439DRAFT_328432 [Meredithblackwellia eburnea MCA 4105]